MVNYILGVGQLGTKLATLFKQSEYNKHSILLTLNTDPRDKVNVKIGNDYLVTEGGAGQNYTRGLKIWAQNKEKLEEYLSPIKDNDVVYFISAGGGSGSSSITTILNILTRQNNRVLLVVILPFLSEGLPATSNATRVLNRLLEYQNVSILLISNDDLAKQIGSTNLDQINSLIIEKVNYIFNLYKIHELNAETPFALDSNDHNSVVFSGGFIDIYTGEIFKDNKPKLPKFPFGNIKDAINVLIARNISLYEKSISNIADEVILVSKKIATANKGARILYGILRNNLPHKYIIIAVGLKIDKVIEKLKTKAITSASLFKEKKDTKYNKILNNKENKLLDI